MTTAIQVFEFQGNPVRVSIDEAGTEWFVAKDVCERLGLNNVSHACSVLSEEDRRIISNDTADGHRKMLCVNESGLYDLIFNSRKPEAKEFRRWVTSEVLPSIRKTGQYIVPREIDTVEALHILSGGLIEQKRMLLAAVEETKQELALHRQAIESVNNRIEYEVKQAVTVERIQSIEWKERKKIEERLSNLEGNDGFYTIRGYINVGGFKQVSTKAAQELGKRCGKYCREHGLTPKIVPDAQYGEVKKWPLEALEHVFKHVPRRGDKATFSHIG